MGRRNAIKITRRAVGALAVERGDAVFRDRDLASFGVRVYDSVALPGVDQGIRPERCSGMSGPAVAWFHLHDHRVRRS